MFWPSCESDSGLFCYDIGVITLSPFLCEGLNYEVFFGLSLNTLSSSLWLFLLKILGYFCITRLVWFCISIYWHSSVCVSTLVHPFLIRRPTIAFKFCKLYCLSLTTPSYSSISNSKSFLWPIFRRSNAWGSRSESSWSSSPHLTRCSCYCLSSKLS